MLAGWVRGYLALFLFCFAGVASGDDTQFPSDWFTPPDLDSSSVISKADAIAFIDDFFSLADRNFYAPDAFSSERSGAHDQAVLAVL